MTQLQILNKLADFDFGPMWPYWDPDPSWDLRVDVTYGVRKNLTNVFQFRIGSVVAMARSEDTFRHGDLDPAFLTRPLEQVAVKGREQGLVVYEVVFAVRSACPLNCKFFKLQ